ncbi:synaptopodin-2-like isoform X2 [Lates japonicus]|uniref:Synaptopodin-2-like isoform X2 n=1 Tax=Lates japonicus TaxID=270547 RepID=A0AAD3MVQ8_LATJO|nr:synaptopodin-2-like isoform X2 [Lates japonicus]
MNSWAQSKIDPTSIPWAQAVPPQSTPQPNWQPSIKDSTATNEYSLDSSSDTAPDTCECLGPRALGRSYSLSPPARVPSTGQKSASTSSSPKPTTWATNTPPTRQASWLEKGHKPLSPWEAASRHPLGLVDEAFASQNLHQTLRLKHPLGSPAQNTARAASRVEGQGVVPSPAENRQPDLEPESKPQSESSSPAIISVSNKECCLHSRWSCWLQVPAQTVAASDVCDTSKLGGLSVFH